MSIVCKTINTTGKHLYGVTVEAFLRKGLPYFSLIGLPDAGLSDTRERIKVGMQASGITWPDCRINVNLAPASMGKADGICDLAIALVVRGLAEYNNNPDYDLHVYLAGLRGLVAIGKINADGDVHSTPISAKDVVAYAVKHGAKRVLVPYSSFLDYLSVEDSEATEIDSCIIKGVEILGIKNLTEAFSVVDGFGNAGNSDIGGLNAKRMELPCMRCGNGMTKRGRAGKAICLTRIISPSSPPTCARSMRRIVMPVTETVRKGGRLILRCRRTHKWCYASELDARITASRIQARKRSGHEEWRAYKCLFCHRWHLTSQRRSTVDEDD